ncbi:hypothetical protein F2P81_001112 [Scophthalmus maximus]|uniref:Uncharacterized protein n=1 Tax=Scophthalmus maximus TaxID=52904 RepID=A0A6A4TRH1_SCOMX|nr:hypothetical protein F2P81_001112 [Scophthalmus maximus]
MAQGEESAIAESSGTVDNTTAAANVDCGATVLTLLLLLLSAYRTKADIDESMYSRNDGGCINQGVGHTEECGERTCLVGTIILAAPWTLLHSTGKAVMSRFGATVHPL